LNDDWFDVLQALLAADARFMVVGAHALAVHGVSRATQDLDVWVDPTPQNAARVWRALVEFGAPLSDLRITPDDLTQHGIVLQLGLPPNRIDLLTTLTGLDGFDAAWTDRVTQSIRGQRVPFLGRVALLQNKRATGRTRDLADVEALEP
jgi:hypothetical protein